MDGFVEQATVDGEDRGTSYFPQAHGFTVHHVGPSYHQSTGRPGLETLLVHSAPSAAFNSKDRSFDTPRCDKDTRIGLIDEILSWLKKEDPATSNMLCMTGSAGSGKSALAQTVAESCVRKGTLAASFFFNSRDPERNRMDRFIASLAYQIARSFGASRPLIVHAVETDPSIFTQSLDWQAEVLLFAPIKEALRNSPQPPPSPPSVIVVDGLDECKGEGDQEQAQQEQILHMLRRCVQELPFLIFLTSRPESAIRAALAPDGFLDADVYQILLNNHDATKDIQLYLERRLRAILRSNIPENWTFQGIIEFLVKQADGLFVHAATVVKFVGERQRSPLRRLEIVLEGRPQQGTHPLAKLDALYSSILFAAQAAYNEIFEEDTHASEPSSFAHRLWALSIASGILLEPLPFVEKFLHWDAGDIERVVEDLHSVVKGVMDDEGAFWLRFYHKSFEDYLKDLERCPEFGVARLPACRTVLSIALDHISSATAEECSQFFEGSDPSLLKASIRALPHLLSMSSAEGIHKPSFDRVDETLHQFSACHGWDKLLKALTCEVAETSRILNHSVAEGENELGHLPTHFLRRRIPIMHWDLKYWVISEDKILPMVALEDQEEVLLFISAVGILAEKFRRETKRYTDVPDGKP